VSVKKNCDCLEQFAVMIISLVTSLELAYIRHDVLITQIRAVG